MMQDLHVVSAPIETLSYTILAQAEKTGPQGPDFGKASPVGLFVIVALLVVVLGIGVLFNRRMKNMTRRREYAERHGMDPFDIDGIDAAMAKDEGLSEWEVEEQTWPLAEPDELAAAYGDHRADDAERTTEAEPDVDTEAEAETDDPSQDGRR